MRAMFRGFFRTAFSALIILLAAAPIAIAQGAPESLRGEWRGRYTCSQGLTGMTLQIVETAPQIVARYIFYRIDENPELPSGCYELTGTFDAATNTVTLAPQRWIRQPDGWVMVPLSGVVDFEAGTFRGDILHERCTTFELTRLERRSGDDSVCYADLFASVD